MAEQSSTKEGLQVAALAALATALTALAARLGQRGAMSNEFVRLTARAKGIAQQAWQVGTSRWSFDENAARLADALDAFADEAQSAAARTMAAVAGDAGAIDALLAHAERIGRLHNETLGSARQIAIRAELQPLETTLVTLQASVGEERRVSEDAAALAKEAASLAQRALELRYGGRAAELAAHDIHAALGAFVEDATAVSRRIAHSAQALGEHTSHMASGTRDLASHAVAGPRDQPSRPVAGPRDQPSRPGAGPRDQPSRPVAGPRDQPSRPASGPRDQPSRSVAGPRDGLVWTRAG